MQNSRLVRRAAPKRTPLSRKPSRKQALLIKEWSRLRWCRLTKQLEDKGYNWCEQCGRSVHSAFELEAHHIEPRARDNYVDSNLLLCCGDCHRKFKE